ncbi:hypothetical protein Tco_0499435 [Tanacetum coccineum]
MDIFVLVKKEYPLSKGIMTVILVNKMKVDQHSEMANELLRKIFIQMTITSLGEDCWELNLSHLVLPREEFILPSLVSTARVEDSTARVMAIFVISISLDSSEESVGTSTAQVILFGTFPTAIPATIPVVDPPVVSTLPHTSLFMYTHSCDSGTSERPPSQDPYEVTVARWRSRVAARSSPPTSPSHDSPPNLCQILPTPPGLPRRPAILVLPGQSMPVGRPYRTQPNGVRKMLTIRKRVRLLPC